jgi:hypothetical protein
MTATKKRIPLREILKEEVRALNRRLTPEQRLLDVLELTNVCFELREAAKKSGYKKGSERDNQRP